MTRVLIVGICAVLATLAGSYAASLWDDRGEMHADSKVPENEVELVKLDSISVPIIRDGSVSGYAIVRASIAVEPKDAAKNKATLSAYGNEAVFRALYEETVDFSNLKPANTGAIADRMTALANSRIGRSAVKHTVIESLNFVEKSEARRFSKQ